MRTRHQIIDDLIEATEYHDTEIILNIDHIRDLLNDAIGHLKDASKVVRDNQRMRRNIQQLKSDNAQQARCIENLTDKLNATNDSLPRWISVEEQMPDVGVNVLLLHPHICEWEDSLPTVEYIVVTGELCTAYGYKRKKTWNLHRLAYDLGEERALGYATHWMTIPNPPEPPKEE